MVLKAKDIYYFIHYIEMDTPPGDEADYISLNDIGYLYIGSGDWHPEIEQCRGNIFFHIEDARKALAGIKTILQLT